MSKETKQRRRKEQKKKRDGETHNGQQTDGMCVLRVMHVQYNGLNTQ